MKKLYTEYDIIDLIKKGTRIINISPETIFTPSALDKIRQANIKVIKDEKLPSQKEASNSAKRLKIKKIAIGCDHTGYELKSAVVTLLKSLSIQTIDVGTYSKESCDYPDFALQVAQKVLNGEADCGIMLDATGIPSAITVNKLPGIRGATCYNEFTAASAREHNNANVLLLGAKAIGEETAKAIIYKWLSTEFAGGRHQRRLDKITDIEENLLNKK